MKLYYYEGSTRKGPIPSVRLREMARKGEVAPETLIETVLGMRFRADEAGSYVSGLSLEKEFANLRAVPPEPSQDLVLQGQLSVFPVPIFRRKSMLPDRYLKPQPGRRCKRVSLHMIDMEDVIVPPIGPG